MSISDNIAPNSSSDSSSAICLPCFSPVRTPGQAARLCGVGGGGFDEHDKFFVSGRDMIFPLRKESRLGCRYCSSMYNIALGRHLVVQKRSTDPAGCVLTKN